MKTHEGTTTRIATPPVAGHRPDTRTVLSAVAGYKELGLFALAREELNRLPEDERRSEEARVESLDLDLMEQRWSEAAEEGLRAEADGVLTSVLRYLTALALHKDGRPAEALALMDRHPELACGSAGEAYGLACYLCAARNFDSAFVHVFISLERADAPSTKAFIDTDLAPLWQHMTTVPMNEDLAIVLVQPCWDQWLAEMGEPPLELALEQADLRRQSPVCRCLPF